MKEKRINDITKYIHQKGFVSIEELCEKFNISISTIRRDLAKILSDHRLKKIYGGVSSVSAKTMSSTIIHYDDRNKIDYKEKSDLAKFASQMIKSDDVIYIDSGTTTKRILEYVDADSIKNLTILTNNADIINYVINYSGSISIKLICIGSVLQPETRSFADGNPELLIGRFNINKAFMSSTGISLENGITNASFSEYEIKTQIMNKAICKILMIGHSKFDNIGLLTYAKLNEINDIITSDTPPKKYTEFFKKNNINIHITK